VASFPALKTGAVAQYPSDRVKQTFTSVYRFIDGREQRVRNGSTALKRWVLRFDLLDEAELTAIEAFFLDQAGQFESFLFTDPWDNAVYPNCSFDDDSIVLHFDGPSKGVTQVTIRENR